MYCREIFSLVSFGYSGLAWLGGTPVDGEHGPMGDGGGWLFGNWRRAEAEGRRGLWLEGSDKMQSAKQDRQSTDSRQKHHTTKDDDYYLSTARGKQQSEASYPT